MLLNLREYHRPGTDGQGVRRVLELLARPDIRTVPLGGGDALVASADDSVQAVVDLQGLGLDILRVDEQQREFGIGAMVTRSALAESEDAVRYCDGILAQGARMWSGSVQRNRATIGGAVAVAASNDPLVAALLACDALICLQDLEGGRRIPIADFLCQRQALLSAPALITEVCIPLPRLSQLGAICRVGRTPADSPIVLAVANVSILDGRIASARVVLASSLSTWKTWSSTRPAGRSLPAASRWRCGRRSSIFCLSWPDTKAWC